MNKLSQNSHIITQIVIWLFVFMTPYGFFLIEGSGPFEAFKHVVPFLPMYVIWMIGFYLCYFIYIPKFYFEKKYGYFFVSVFVTYYSLNFLLGKLMGLIYPMPDEIPEIGSGIVWLSAMRQVFVNLLLVMTAIAIRIQQQQNEVQLAQQDTIAKEESHSSVAASRPLTEEAGVANVMQAPQPIPTYIFVKCEYKQVRIDLDDIMYVSSMKDYVRIRLVSQQIPITALSTLKAIEEKLPSERFCRVHRSHIVAIDKVESVENNRIKIADQLIPISDTYQDRFNGRL